MTKNNNVTFKGQNINLWQLEAIFPKSQALVVKTLLQYLQSNKFSAVYDGVRCSIKSLDAWSKDLIINFENGTKRNMSKSALCKALKALLDCNIIQKIKRGGLIKSYSINDIKLVEALNKRLPDFQFENN